MVMNKKGSELTLSTIIIIVLGIAVLVFLIFGFSTGWTNLWSKITAYGGGNANVDTIKQACALACGSQQKAEFCDNVRTVKYSAKIDAWNGTGISNVIQSPGTCQNMTDSTNYPGVNVEPCTGLC
jgi:hypothetical protein